MEKTETNIVGFFFDVNDEKEFVLHVKKRIRVSGVLTSCGLDELPPVEREVESIANFSDLSYLIQKGFINLME